MDYLNENIAINLRKIRNAKGMSLDLAAEQTGVSKSLFAQIERGEANPSIGSISKIISGLRVELSSLLDSPRLETYHIPKEKMVPSKEIIGQYRVCTLFPYEKDREFEIYGIEVEPGGVYYSGAHGENTIEYLTVSKGILTLKMSDQEYVIKQGDAFRFDSDKEHHYCNKGEDSLEITVVFSF